MRLHVLWKWLVSPPMSCITLLIIPFSWSRDTSRVWSFGYIPCMHVYEYIYMYVFLAWQAQHWGQFQTPVLSPVWPQAANCWASSFQLANEGGAQDHDHDETSRSWAPPALASLAWLRSHPYCAMHVWHCRRHDWWDQGIQSHHAFKWMSISSLLLSHGMSYYHRYCWQYPSVFRK